MRRLILALATWLAATACLAAAETPPPDKDPEVKFSTTDGPLRIAIVGMVHGHVEGLLWNAGTRQDLQLVGVYEPDRALFDRLAAKHKIDPALHFADLGAMLDQTRPEAVSVMSSIADHVAAAEACAPRGVHMLFEKPLAFAAADAARIAELARTHRVLALTNFETSWYAAVREAGRLVASGECSPLRRMVFRHGHKGPKEIGCSEEFVGWLTDPAANGGGAVVDFGCYGAVLATWLMNGQRPTQVVACGGTLKPTVYPRVDDDATIVLTYPGATAVIQASWAWTHDNKEMDLYAETCSLHAAKWNDLTRRRPDQPPEPVKPPPIPEGLANEWTYLKGVVRGRMPIDPLSSLEHNVIVAEILEEARRQMRAASAP